MNSSFNELFCDQEGIIGIRIDAACVTKLFRLGKLVYILKQVNFLDWILVKVINHAVRTDCDLKQILAELQTVIFLNRFNLSIA